jgi:hypothetical protein
MREAKGGGGGGCTRISFRLRSANLRDARGEWGGGGGREGRIRTHRRDLVKELVDQGILGAALEKLVLQEIGCRRSLARDFVERFLDEVLEEF